MKILLIRPPVPPHTIGLKHIMNCEPLELEYVAANLGEHDIQILDLITEKGFEKRFRIFDPDVVGSSCYITGVNEVIKIIRKAKTWKKDCFTVAGGVQASLAPEDFADPSVDCIIRGDGTTVLPEVINAIENNTSLFDVPGLAIPVGDREVELTGERPYMPPPDSLPFPRRDLVAHLQHKYYYLMHRPVALMKTTWGCWYQCNFCYTWKITNGIAYSRSPESIVKELEEIKANEVYIVDDIFLISRPRLKKIAELIRERNIRKKYLVYSRADFIAENEDIIAEWSDLGLNAVFIGLEAVTDYELESLDKETTVDNNIRAVEILRKYKIDTYGSLIPSPYYMPWNWTRLWDFIRRNRLYYINISPLTPMPGTLIWESFKDQLIVPRTAHGLWDLSHVVIDTRMSRKRYYRSLLWLYSRTILNLSRAQKVTQRTLPSVWSLKYLKIILGALKIGWQFLNAHHHHTLKALKKSMYKGPEVEGLTYNDKFLKPFFKKAPATCNL